MGEKDELVFGRHPVLEALKAGSPILRIHVSREARGLPPELFKTAEDEAIPVVRVHKERLDSMVGGKNHQGVIAQMGKRCFLRYEDWLKEVKENSCDCILALDQVQDPQNLGALLRSSEGAGCTYILLSSAKSCGLTSTVSKVSAGADQHLRLTRTAKMQGALQSLKELGYQVVGTSPAAENDYYEADFSRPTVLLLGGEGRGLAPHLKRVATHVVNIPMLGKVQSLNVASSGAILLYEALRQRQREK